ncbi:MAG: hypothetical protein ACOCRX_05155 [Candidatus Woesearchaeota archaeon]
MNLKEIIQDFILEISKGNIEIYNEFSVQFELAIFLRELLSSHYKVQLERNIEFFQLKKSQFLKKEMDIVIFDQQFNEKYCIELKYPTNGQYPEQMFKICEYVAFIEQLVESGFKKSFSLVFAQKRPFYMEKGGAGIYEMFRLRREIEGIITKPTGKKDKVIEIQGKYKFNWKTIYKELKYFLVQVG